MLRIPLLFLGVSGALALASDVVGPSRALPPEAVDPRVPGDVPKELGASDWSSIRAAYETGRHTAFAVAGGFQARNPGQQWLTRFDGRGFSTEPDAGGWTWGLQLERFGFAGSECTVSKPTQVSAAGPRVAYDWDSTLQEWYVNDPRGLEHGYTVHQRPRHESLGERGPLTLTLAVRGELTPQVQADGRGVCFVNGDGAAVLTYAGLSVSDAGGQVLAARFEPLAEVLVLTIDERGARYPLKIDPVAQQAYLKASNTDRGDVFGTSVSVSGDTVVVGAPGEASTATGVNGDQSDNSGPDSGAAYVFARSGTTWSQQAYLKASNTDFFGWPDHFGWSVSVSGDTVVVGAYGEASSATGVDGNQGDNSADLAGAAYVFVRSGTTWSQQAYLKASNTGMGDLFGFSVSVSGNTVVVGARDEDSNATGVNGDQSDNSAGFAGAAYVFARSGTTWSQQAYLKASNTGALDGFGTSVSVSSDTVVVGAFEEDSSAIGVNAESNEFASNSGAAYVFVRGGTTWSQQAYLKASNTGAGDWFGWSVSVAGSTVAIGAPEEDSNTTTVNGDQSNNSALSAGAAYVFVRSGSIWSQQAYLKASNAGSGDRFARSVSVSGNTVVVGAPLEDSNATGVNGDQTNNSATQAGAAYAFVRSGAGWTQQAYLKASNTEPNDAFGDSVSVSGDTVVVGAPVESSNASGVNGDQGNNSAPAAGAVFVVDLQVPWTDLGSGLSGSSGVPLLVGTGPLSPSSINQLDLTDANPSSVATLIIGLSQLSAPLKGGTLVPAPLLLVPLLTNPSGAMSLPFTWPAGVPAGMALYFQFWFSDPGAIFGLSASNAIEGVSS